MWASRPAALLLMFGAALGGGRPRAHWQITALFPRRGFSERTAIAHNAERTVQLCPCRVSAHLLLCFTVHFYPVEINTHISKFSSEQARWQSGRRAPRGPTLRVRHWASRFASERALHLISFSCTAESMVI